MEGKWNKSFIKFHYRHILLSVSPTPYPLHFHFFSPLHLLYFVFCVSEPRGLSLSDTGSASVKLIMTEICAGLAFFLPFSARRKEWGERSSGKVVGWVGGSGGWGWDEGRPSLRGGGWRRKRQRGPFPWNTPHAFIVHGSMPLKSLWVLCQQTLACIYSHLDTHSDS